MTDKIKEVMAAVARRRAPQQQQPSAPFPMFVGQGERPDLRGIPGAFDPARHLPKRLLRKAAADEAKRLKQTAVLAPMTEAMIPDGSLISDETLEEIRTGQYVVARSVVPPQSPTRFSRRAIKRRRLRAAKKGRRG